MIGGLSEGCRDGGPLLVLGVGTSPPHPPAHGEPANSRSESCRFNQFLRDHHAKSEGRSMQIVGGPGLVRSNSFLGFAEQSVGVIEEAGATVLYALIIRKWKKYITILSSNKT